MSEQQNNEKSNYFSLSEAWDEVSYGVGAAEKATASLKLFGKGLFNAGKYLVTDAIPAIVEENIKKSNELLKNDYLTDEQRSRMEEIRDKSTGYAERTKKNDNG